MREMFVSELVKDTLGPRGAIDETLTMNPFNQFMTGILKPLGADEADPASDHNEFGNGPSTSEDSESEDTQLFTTVSPSLSPGEKPSTMGISFRVESGRKINLKICITWARYIPNEGGNQWTREPHHAIFPVSFEKTERIPVDDDNNVTDNANPAITLDAYERVEGEGTHFVSLYLVNRTELSGTDRKTGNPKANIDDFVFQPQIRVITGAETKIVAGKSVTGHVQAARTDEEEDRLDFLFRKRLFKARGHLTSAVWKEIDPEREYENAGELDYPECANSIPFAWADGTELTDEERAAFTAPDVRTEYVPLYQISAPKIEWDEIKLDDDAKPPELNAGSLAEICEPRELENALVPLYESYMRWIEGLESEAVEPENRAVSQNIIRECRTVLQRIRLGIDTVCDEKNPDATLAFCFANKAINLQYGWAHNGDDMEYRPFQLAYVLMCIESIVNKESSYRDVCDLMWVPTGTGKTEAYLALAVFTMAYRRRLALSGDGEPTGAGVSIITRYTLRLLTIQQFRRTVSVITAAEMLRVDNLSASSRVGWRPEKWRGDENFVWGSSQFSAGLWIGAGVTPNKLYPSQSQSRTDAVSILKGEDGNSQLSYETEAEPAQILNCPCCHGILSISKAGLDAGDNTLHMVVRTETATDISGPVNNLAANGPFRGINVTGAAITPHEDPTYHTISLTVNRDFKTKAEQIDQMWTAINEHLNQAGIPLEMVPSRASRPGYFVRYYTSRGSTTGRMEFDFEIFCPNPNCPLHVPWFRGSPTGCIQGRIPDGYQQQVPLNNTMLPDGNSPDDVQHAFKKKHGCVADRVPIPALTADTQVYHRVPTIIVSTVDKFARPPFESEASSLFGNVDRHHMVYGYFSEDMYNDTPLPGRRNARNYATVAPLHPPDLILQDELHLIDGPLGSMVGIYETAVDFLCSHENNVKYIASTATIKKAEDHVMSLFCKSLQTFPPHGLVTNDRFFVKDDEAHPLADGSPGRLYLGICPIGLGALTPIKNIWARLAQTAWERQYDNHIQDLERKLDPFWTLTAYFNAIRELAGALNLYRQDIIERTQLLNSQDHRPLRPDPEFCPELSSRMTATELPAMLDVLNKEYRPNSSCADSVFTTSMFGTGVDVPRLGLMLVNGQPKTTATYIQASGRVGRRRGGLVVTLLRGGKPRDLNHFEFFARHHRQIHRFVEPPTVYPFARGVTDRALGPIGVFILRHMRNATIRWKNNHDGIQMLHHNGEQEVIGLQQIIARRQERQPEIRRAPPNAPAGHLPQNKMAHSTDYWHAVCRQLEGNNRTDRPPALIYSEYTPPNVQRTLRDVVLGDAKHQSETATEDGPCTVVYENCPQSLRDLEEETSFQTEDGR